MRLNGKSIIVTGVGSGIGEGIARRRARNGAQVIVNNSNTQTSQRVAEVGRASFFQGDVTQSKQVHTLDVANAALYFAGDKAAFISGVGVEIDGVRCV